MKTLLKEKFNKKIMSFKQKSIKDYLIDVINEKQEPKKILTKEVNNNNYEYDGNDVNKFWFDNGKEFKKGKYFITFNGGGITKIERVDETKCIKIKY